MRLSSQCLDRGVGRRLIGRLGGLVAVAVCGSLFAAGSAQAAIVQVQKGSEVNATTGTISPALASASTAGNLLVAVVGNANGCAAFSAPAGWVLATSVCSAAGGMGDVEIWYYPANPGGISSATFTASSGSKSIVGELSEYSGASIGSPLDQTGTVKVTTTQGSATVSTGAATGQSGELAVTGFQEGTTAQTFTAGTSWSALYSDGTRGYESDYQNGLAAGTVSETVTSSKSQQWVGAIATFATLPTGGGLGTWAAQTSGDANALLAVSCADTTHCWAVDGKAGIIATTNGGTSWAPQTSPLANTNVLQGIDCPDTTHCWAVDSKGDIIVLSSGAWSKQTTIGTGSTDFTAISCSDTSHCWTVGNSGVAEATSNGGGTWTAQTSNAGTNNLLAISCPDSTDCEAVDNHGGLVTTSNGGSTWSARSDFDANNAVQGISCTDASHCWAVDSAGGILATTNGGGAWTPETSGTTQSLKAVACLATGGGTDCWAAGGGGANLGTIVMTRNGGTSWSIPIAAGAQAFNGVDAAGGGRAWAVGAAGVIEGFAGPCSTGSLSLAAPSTITLPGITLTGKDQTDPTTASLTPDDETANLLGWNLSATSTTFTNAGGKTLPTTATTFTGASVAATAGSCLLPTNSITYPVTLPAGSSPPTATKVYNAAAASGAGSSTVTLTPKLTIPGNSYNGTYSSTWTFTIASGP